MKLNLGCGDHYATGWVNVDTVDCPHTVDVRADITASDDWSGLVNVTHAYLGHVLEHLTMNDAVLVLHRVADVMVPGGMLLVVGPDVDRAYDMYQRGALTKREYLGVVHGRQAWPGDEHRWMCSEEVIKDLLRTTGRWESAASIPLSGISPIWPLVSRVEWQCAVSALVKS